MLFGQEVVEYLVRVDLDRMGIDENQFEEMKVSSGVESFTISSINFSIHGSNNRFFDIFYEGSRLNQAYMVLKLRNNY